MILHLVTQRGQPFGSVRRCCEQCGIMTVPGPPVGSKVTDDPDVWERSRSGRLLAEGTCFTACSGRPERYLCRAATGCLSGADYVATNNVPAAGHVCTDHWKLLPPDAQANYAPLEWRA